MPTSLYLVRSSLCVSFLFLVQFKTSVLFTDEDGFIQSVSLSLLKAAINTMGKYLKSTSTIENRETHFQNEEQKKEVLQANLKFCNSGKSSFVHVCIWWSLYLSRLKTRSKFRFWIKYTHAQVFCSLYQHIVWELPAKSGLLITQIMIRIPCRFFKKLLMVRELHVNFIHIHLSFGHTYGFTLFECISSAPTLAKQIHFSKERTFRHLSKSMHCVHGTHIVYAVELPLVSVSADELLVFLLGRQSRSCIVLTQLCY